MPHYINNVIKDTQIYRKEEYLFDLFKDFLKIYSQA